MQGSTYDTNIKQPTPKTCHIELCRSSKEKQNAGGAVVGQPIQTMRTTNDSVEIRKRNVMEEDLATLKTGQILDDEIMNFCIMKTGQMLNDEIRNFCIADVIGNCRKSMAFYSFNTFFPHIHHHGAPNSQIYMIVVFLSFAIFNNISSNLYIFSRKS